MRPQRHSLPQTCNHERIGHSEQGKVLTECQILGVKENNRLVGERRETRIDSGNNVSDAALELILARSLEGDLDEDGLRDGG